MTEKTSHCRKPQRVRKACERCRIKKTRCNGNIPCKGFRDVGTHCQHRKKRVVVDRKVPPGYIDFLEEQHNSLTAGLHEAFRQLHASESAEWSRGLSTHEILTFLGVSHSESRQESSQIAENPSGHGAQPADAMNDEVAQWRTDSQSPETTETESLQATGSPLSSWSDLDPLRIVPESAMLGNAAHPAVLRDSGTVQTDAWSRPSAPCQVMTEIQTVQSGMLSIDWTMSDGSCHEDPQGWPQVPVSVLGHADFSGPGLLPWDTFTPTHEPPSDFSLTAC